MAMAGKVVALRNHGIAHLQSARSQFGDLLVHFVVRAFFFITLKPRVE